MKKVNQEVNENEMKTMENQKKRTVQNVLIEDVNLLRGLMFTTDEVEKFGMVITKVKQDLMACVDAMIREKEREAQNNADTDAE